MRLGRAALSPEPPARRRAPGDRFAKDALLGARLAGASGLVLAVELPTPRCVVPTRAHDDLPADLRILRAVVEQHRVDLGPFGRQGCLGAYAEVAHGGRVEVGASLDVEASPATFDEALTTAVERLLLQRRE